MSAQSYAPHVEKNVFEFLISLILFLNLLYNSQVHTPWELGFDQIGCDFDWARGGVLPFFLFTKYYTYGRFKKKILIIVNF